MMNPGDDDDDVLISFWLHTHTKRSDISMINESVNKINVVKEDTITKPVDVGDVSVSVVTLNNGHGVLCDILVFLILLHTLSTVWVNHVNVNCKRT